MNQEWVLEQNAKQEAERTDILSKVRSAFERRGFMESHEIDAIIQGINENIELGIYAYPLSTAVELRKDFYGDDKVRMLEYSSIVHDVIVEIDPLLKRLFAIRYPFDYLLDGEAVEFDGDIIITDPCYVIKYEDWDKCDDGDNLEALGISTCMMRSTLYDDWSCSVYDTDKRKKIGDFCTDGGMVAVFLLDEVLKYNPSFDYHINRKWTTTLIKNFKGTVQFVIEEEKFEYDGEECTDYSVHVVGHGINKRSGNPKNFKSLQTGF